MVIIAVIKNNNCNFENIGDYAAKLLYKPYTKDQIRSIREPVDNYIW